MGFKTIRPCLAAACLFLCLCSKNPTNAPVIPTVAFSSAKQTVYKNSGSARVDVLLSAAGKSKVTIPFMVMSSSTANNPLDYTLDSSPLVIPAGDSIGRISMLLIDNDTYQLSKTVILQLETPTNAVLGTRVIDTVIILDTTTLPAVAFSSVRQIVGDDSGTVKIEAVLSAAGKYSMTIPIVVSGNSTANSPQDYTPGSTQIVIPAGDSTGSISLSLVPQTVYEAGKTIILSFGAPTSANLGADIIDTVFIVNAQGFGQQYKFADNELPGWTQDTTTGSKPYTVWKGEELVGLIDGGADLYTNRGCLLSMYQNLVGPNGPDSQICTVVAMICGTDAQADSIFVVQKVNTGATVAIPQYDTSVAIASAGIAGNITAYAHFKTMYFELQLSGYSDQESSCSEAEQMLKILESKTN